MFLTKIAHVVGSLHVVDLFCAVPEVDLGQELEEIGCEVHEVHEEECH